MSDQDKIILGIGLEGGEQVAEQLNEMKGSTKEIKDNLNNTKADSFTAAMRAAKNEALSLAAANKENTQEYSRAIAEVARLKDVLNDVRVEIDGLDPGRPLAGFVNLGTGIAQAFAGVQGAMGLLGGESQDVQKALLKVQSAMALIEGIGSFDNVKDGLKQITGMFKETGLVTQIWNKGLQASGKLTSSLQGAVRGVTGATTAATGAMTGLQAAIAGLGIGILIAGITFLIVKMADWLSATDEQTKAQKKLNDELDKTYSAARIKNADRDLKVAHDKEIARLKEIGATQSQIAAENNKYRQQQINILNARLNSTDPNVEGGTAIENAKLQNRKYDAEHGGKALTEEETNRIKELQTQRTELEGEIRDLQGEIEVENANLKADIAVKGRADAKKRAEDAAKDKKDSESLATQLRKEAAQYKLEAAAIAKEINANNAEALSSLQPNPVEAKYNVERMKLEQKYNDDLAKIDTQKVDSKGNLQYVIRDEKERNRLKEVAYKTWLINAGKMEADFRKELKKQDQADIEEKYTLEQSALEQSFADRLITQEQYNDAVVALEVKKAQEIYKANPTPENKAALSAANSGDRQNQDTKIFNNLSDQKDIAGNDKLKFKDRYAANDAEIAILKDLYDKKVLTEREYNKKVKEVTDERKGIRSEEVAAYLGASQDVVSALEGISGVIDQDRQYNMAKLDAEYSKKMANLKNGTQAQKDALNKEYEAKKESIEKGTELERIAVKANKVVNAANATMNAWMGITQIWRAESVLPEPFATAAKVASTITAAASAFKAVKAIRDTPIPGGDSGGGGSTPSVDSLTPVIQSSLLNIPQQVTGLPNNSQQVTRAYIVDSDLRTQEQRNAFINRTNSIG